VAPAFAAVPAAPADSALQIVLPDNAVVGLASTSSR